MLGKEIKVSINTSVTLLGEGIGASQPTIPFIVLCHPEEPLSRAGL